MAMTPAIRKGKQNRHEKITVCLLSGNPVTVDEIKAVFKGTKQEALMYRLSSNIYSIRRDGGVVKVIKTGKIVTAYQLINFKQFDKNGRFIQPNTVKNNTNIPVIEHEIEAVETLSERSDELVEA